MLIKGNITVQSIDMKALMKELGPDTFFVLVTPNAGPGWEIWCDLCEEPYHESALVTLPYVEYKITGDVDNWQKGTLTKIGERSPTICKNCVYWINAALAEREEDQDA